MSRVIMFSREYPVYHPQRGQPTFFPEKLFNSLHRAAGVVFTNIYSLVDLNPGKEKEAEEFWDTVQMNHCSLSFKGHTIRSGSRWKAGDKFSPRVWAGKPYASKTITIAPDIEIKKVWDFRREGDKFWLGKGTACNPVLWSQLDVIASNDGLGTLSLMDWIRYPKPFTGQIVCWDESINY